MEIKEAVKKAKKILEKGKMKKDKEFMEIITTEIKGKPYYEIKYLDLSDNKVHIGYSSFFSQCYF